MKKFFEGTCVDYTFDGLGICKLDNGTPVFVPGMIKGEVGTISYNETQKSFYNGKLERFTHLSPNREIPKCLLYAFCGGCQTMHMSYIEQCSFKEKHVQETLKRIGGIDIKVNPIIKNPSPLRYRNKVQVSYSRDFDGKILGGFYMEGSHKVVNRDLCYLENEDADNIASYFKTLLAKFNIEPYEKGNNLGYVKNVLVRTSSLKQIMIVIVTKGKMLPKKKELVSSLIKKFPLVKTIIQNVNPASQGNILGEEEYILYGDGYIEDTLCGLKFAISSKSFFQINHDQTERLYSYAIEKASLSGKERVLDAYCGIGTIGLIASKKAKEVVGVEIIPEAIKNAKDNAETNHITNAEFYALDAKEFIKEEKKKGSAYDVVFVDPPRGGCDEEFIVTLMDFKPDRIVYISCNPSTLARDLKIFSSSYEVKDVQPVDMFSQTYHVETVCLLSKKAPV